MFNLKFRTNGRSFDRIVNVNDRVCDALDREDISTQGTTIALNGKPISDLSTTFAALGVSSGTQAMISVVVKTESAM